MGALPEYKTRVLLENEECPLVEGVFVAAGSDIPDALPNPPVYLKAQIPGATSRAAHGLVRRADTKEAMEAGLKELLAAGPWGQAEGVLVASAVTIVKEYYAACMLDFGSAEKLPGGVLIFSTEGGSGVEERTESLRKIPFSLLNPPSADDLGAKLGEVENKAAVASFLQAFIKTFARYKLTVLETNPLCVLDDGSLVVVDCRAEFEGHAVGKKDKELFAPAPTAEKDMTRLEELVEKINEGDPAGTGFVREEREPIPEGAWCVATNLCGGGGKMLWEMTTGARDDIYSMNESDTSGGLSGFKSYRILRAILEQMEGSQVLILTGSGMGFQNQRHLASAMWKGLRESPKPLPAMLRFGGTDEDMARALFEKVGPTLPVKVKTYFAHIFPNAMVDDISEIATKERITVTPEPQPEGEPTFSVAVPQGDFFFYPDKWTKDEAPPCVAVCPSDFLAWNAEKRTIEPVEGARCTGCLECETVSLVDSNSELRIRLNMPEVD
jgi:succinyl-CoA synthetase beta subunit/NAD-dependent dihydropyrimidine dehydrogenase PreA subunit